MPLLFSYGTLQLARVQLATFGRRLQGRPDELTGYEPSRVPITDREEAATIGRTHHDNVVWSGRDASSVKGTVFEVTDTDLAAADRYEEPAAYRRITVTLASGKRAWVYLHGHGTTG